MAGDVGGGWCPRFRGGRKGLSPRFERDNVGCSLSSQPCNPERVGTLPTHPHAPVLVPRHIDGLDIRQAEVPHDLRVQEGRHKAAAGSVHMDGHLQPLLLLHLLCVVRGGGAGGSGGKRDRRDENRGASNTKTCGDAPHSRYSNTAVRQSSRATHRHPYTCTQT